MILALETSCDDTCAAVVEGTTIRSNVISSQAELHRRFGGVVPEVASRHHLELVNPVVDAALADAGVGLDEIERLAVTRGPGLIGALLVGLATAKGLAAADRKPLVGVDHLHGHVAANFLDPDPLDPPFLCLVASGGHTLLAGVTAHDSFEVLGQTLDDAAGEALDKAARLLGLGYPGGAIGMSDELAEAVATDKVVQYGTFNGNPLVMAAAEATLTKVLTPDAYEGLSSANEWLLGECDRIIETHGLPCYTQGLGAKGCVIFSAEPLREYRDYLTKVDDELSALAWLYHMNNGVFMTPGAEEEWTVSIAHTEADLQRYVDALTEFAEDVTAAG